MSRSVDSSTQYESSDAEVNSTTVGQETAQVRIISNSNTNDIPYPSEVSQSSSPEEPVNGETVSPETCPITNTTNLSTAGSDSEVGGVGVGVRLRRTVAFSSEFRNNSGGSEGETKEESQVSLENLDEPSNNMEESANAEEGLNDIRFTIKFLNDTQKEVTSHVGENIANFKR